MIPLSTQHGGQVGRPSPRLCSGRNRPSCLQLDGWKIVQSCECHWHGEPTVRQFSPHLHSSLSRRRLLRLVCWKMVQDPTVFGWVNAFRRVGRSSPQLGISFKRLSYLQPGGWKRMLSSSLYSASKASRWDEPHLTHTPASRLRYVQLDCWTLVQHSTALKGQCSGQGGTIPTSLMPQLY